jgi:hypothetical protein
VELELLDDVDDEDDVLEELELERWHSSPMII